MFGTGISHVGSILDAALKYDLIEKAGAWYSLGGEKIGQGREKTIEYLEEHKDVADDLEKKLRSIMFGEKATSESVAP